jgi:DNA-directed RNA polymerase specialized sigma24 family protein
MEDSTRADVTMCNRSAEGGRVGSDDEREDEEVSVLADHRAEPDDDVPPVSSPTATATGPPATGPSTTGPSSTGPSTTGPSTTGPSTTGPSTTGPSTTLEPLDGDAPEESAGVAEPDEVAPPEAARLRPEQLRADFGAHFEANYQRLVAQLYAITLNPAEAHDVVREAYSRAWRRWGQIGASADPLGWVRRVAVRSTMRSWRRTAARVAFGRRTRTLVDGGEPRTRAMLTALARLPDTERRAVVLVDMAGVPIVEVAALEQVPPGTVAARLSRGRRVVGDALVDVEPVAPGLYGQEADW